MALEDWRAEQLEEMASNAKEIHRLLSGYAKTLRSSGESHARVEASTLAFYLKDGKKRAKKLRTPFETLAEEAAARGTAKQTEKKSKKSG